MSEEKKKRNKIIGISIGILIVLLVVISGTYAYWQITRSQNTSNDIIAACLDIDMESVDGTFALNPAWPISDTEGMNLKGYTFKVTNNCEEDVNYIIGMDSLEVSGVEYLDYNSIKVSIDDSASMIYDDKETIDHIEENDQYTIRTSKKIATSTVRNGQPNEHNVKVWIKSDAPIEEQSRVFSGRMFIIGGQNITPDVSADACFEMSGNEIVDYNNELPECGTSVIIPAKVNGVAVKSIDSDAFKTVSYNYNYNFGIVAEGYNPVAAIIFNKEKEQDIKEWAASVGFTEDVIPFYYEDNVVVGEGQKIQYCPDAEMGELPECVDTEGNTLKTEYTSLTISELDLSQAYNLEKIEKIAFSDVTIEENSDSIEGCTTAQLNEPASTHVGLKKLNFGDNDNYIKLGIGTFAYADLGDLTVYTTLEQDNDEYYCESENMAAFLLSSSFEGAEINNLNLKVGKDLTIYDGVINKKELGGNAVLSGANINNLNISEGITELGGSVFTGGLGTRNTGIINNVNLPNTLQKINDFGLGNVVTQNVNVPLSVNYIGEQGIGGMKSGSTITMLGRKNLDGMTLGNNWNGSATIVYP